MDLYRKQVNFDVLIGQTIKSISGLQQGSEEILFTTEEGNEYKMYHEQDCCESVELSDFDGDESDLLGGLVVSASEESNQYNDEDEEVGPYQYSESWTWTFYKIQTTKGHVWLRWLGESNGYYSEDVDFAWLNKPDTEA